MHQILYRLGLHPIPRWGGELTALARPHSWISWAYFKRRDGRGKGKGKGGGKEGEGGERKEGKEKEKRKCSVPPPTFE